MNIFRAGRHMLKHELFKCGIYICATLFQKTQMHAAGVLPAHKERKKSDDGLDLTVFSMGADYPTKSFGKK